MRTLSSSAACESSSTPELRQTESGNPNSAGNSSLPDSLDPSSTPTAEFYRAIRYLDKVKTRHPPDQSDTYEQFLEIMQAYRKGRDSLSEDSRRYQRGEQRVIEDVCTRVQALFKDEEDLIREFERFMPPSSISGSESSRVEGRITEWKARL